MEPLPLRVCLVSPLPPPYGGIGNWTLLMLKHAGATRAVSIDVIDISPRWRAFHEMGVTRRVLGGGLQLCRDMATLVARLARHRPDVLHLTTPGRLAPVRDVVMMALARAVGTRVVYHIRFGRIPTIAAARTREWRLIRTAVRMADVVVPIDCATERALHAHAPEAHVARVPNCIDPSTLPVSGTRGGEPYLLFLGFVVPEKGIGELLDAWARLRPTGWRLVIAGAVSERYRREVLARHDLAGVELTGELAHDEAMQLLAGAEGFTLPSHTEGFPNVVLEAMTLGKAIVASSVGAVPEMLSDGCGIVVPPRDVDRLADALRRLVADAQLRSDMGRRARDRALVEYSIGAVFERWKEIWSGHAAVPEQPAAPRPSAGAA